MFRIIFFIFLLYFSIRSSPNIRPWDCIRGEIISGKNFASLIVREGSINSLDGEGAYIREFTVSIAKFLKL